MFIYSLQNLTDYDGFIIIVLSKFVVQKRKRFSPRLNSVSILPWENLA